MFSTLYASLAVSSLFVPSFVVNRLGCKMTLVVAIGIHILYMIAHFLPRFRIEAMNVVHCYGIAGTIR